jgi:hypothetical protein
MRAANSDGHRPHKLYTTPARHRGGCAARAAACGRRGCGRSPLRIRRSARAGRAGADHARSVGPGHDPGGPARSAPSPRLKYGITQNLTAGLTYNTDFAQVAVSGNVSVEAGTFYNGRRTTLAVRSGRFNVGPRFSFEPTTSVNWIDLDQGAFTTAIVGSRVTYTPTPRMFVSALVQTTPARTRCRRTCGCAGSTTLEASYSSSTTSSGTRERRAFPSSPTARSF